MADQYNSTQQQLNKEIAAMHLKMTDPIQHEKKFLEDKHKKNVKRTSKRYGL